MKQAIETKLIGNEIFLLDLCREYLNKYDFINCSEIMSSTLFLKSQLPSNKDLVILDLPYNTQEIYEFALQTKRIYAKAYTVAIAPSSRLSKILNLQHIDKFFSQVVSREKTRESLDKLAMDMKANHNILVSNQGFVKFTSREKQIIELTCKELDTKQISQQLNITSRTLETHRANIYRKLGSTNPIRIYRYAKNFGLI
jgi:DNA-binding NarL/FixJ family response regulator